MNKGETFLVPPKGGFGYGQFVVKATDCLPVVVAELELIKKDAADHYGNQLQEETGELMKLAARTARIYGKATEDSIVRRLYDIVRLRQITISAPLADALLLACGTTLASEAVPTLPTGIAAAKEMIRTAVEINEELVSEAEIRRRASALLRFTRGYLYDDVLDAEKERAAEEARLAAKAQAA